MADDDDRIESGNHTGGGPPKKDAGGLDEGAADEGAAQAAEQPESLLPYDLWTEQALRRVVATALSHVAENGLPGEHHFFLTFRTDVPGVVIPPRLRAQYPQEMTIVLQHQFWGLSVEPATELVSVGLSFGGVPSTLQIPLAAVTGFADPQVSYGLRFRPPEPAAPPAVPASAVRPAGLPAPLAHTDAPAPDDAEDADPDLPRPDPTPQVVSLDAFRRRPPPKEGA